jgi:hypothetical protein
MAIIDKKRKIFGNIAAARTLTEGLPQLKLSSSFPSINNGGNSITFLTDLIKALIGYESLVETIVDILTHSISDIEREIKTGLKQELKTIVSCGVNPSLPPFIKSNGSGIIIEVNKIDFLDILRTNPNSDAGKLLYNDITTPITNSSDLNTFLYGVIQNEGTTYTWKGMLDFTFNQNGINGGPNNTLTIKTNSSYDSKTLTDLNNDFINSLSLFNSENIVNRLIDIIFGSISVSIKKTKKQLENEAKINNVIDNIINSDSDDTISDDYFVFTNEEIYKQEQEADLRQNGIIKLECCNKISASVPIDMLSTFTNEMSTATPQTKKSVIASNLDKMATQNTANSTNPVDKTTIKLNFIQQLINNLVKSIIGLLLTPKVVIIFLINFKIIYGTASEFDGGVDFIKKNKNLINNIMKKISGIIIKILTAIALKRITELVTVTEAKKEIDKNKAKLTQILSLVGVPQDALRMIKGLL